MIVSDNGTELTARAIRQRQEDQVVEWHDIAPGKPAEWLRREPERPRANWRQRQTISQLFKLASFPAVGDPYPRLGSVQILGVPPRVCFVDRFRQTVRHFVNLVF